MNFVIGLFLLFVSATAFASPGNPDNWCRNGAFPKEGPSFTVVSVKGEAGSRIHFLSDDEGCPSENQKCSKKAYLIPGDKVLVSRSYQNWICAWFEPAIRTAKTSETVGWLPLKSLSIEPVKQADVKSFVGKWKYGMNQLEIKPDASGVGLFIEGEAFWKGLGDNIHNGSLAGKVVVQGNSFKIPELEECVVEGYIADNFLIVADNNQCGGANVTFTGVYKKY